jgi:hypothetical protein
MPKKKHTPEEVAGQFSDEEMQALKLYGQALGGKPTPFDEEVEKHLAGHEAHFAKMRAAQTGGASEEGLGPSDIERAQQQGKSAAGQQATLQGAQAAQAAQQQAVSPSAPAAPSGPAGVSRPYPAQAGPQSQAPVEQPSPDVQSAEPPPAPGEGESSQAE